MAPHRGVIPGEADDARANLRAVVEHLRRQRSEGALQDSSFSVHSFSILIHNFSV